MAKKIAISNQKGGVAKTTTALCLADALIHCDYSVLFVDLDAQCNSTSVYEAIVDDQCTVADLLKSKCTVQEAIQKTEMGDIIAGDPALAGIAPELDREINRYELLKEALEPIENDYDFIIMDTPPGEGLYMLNAFFAADGTIIPLTGEKFAVDGLAKIVQTIDSVRKHGNPELEIYGVLMNKYDGRKRLDKMIWKELKDVGEEYGFKIFEQPIRVCQEVGNAQADHVSLFEMNPNCNASLDYAALAKELLSAWEMI